MNVQFYFHLFKFSSIIVLVSVDTYHGVQYEELCFTQLLFFIPIFFIFRTHVFHLWGFENIPLGEQSTSQHLSWASE